MGRRKLPDSEKRQLHSLRLDPQDREAIEAIAKQEGQSFAAVAERHLKAGLQILAHPMMSAELMQVFQEILDEMQEVQSRNNNHRWTKSLKTWAACKLIFAKGPFARRNPDDWKQDETIDRIWSGVTKARQTKQQAVELLASIGVTVQASKFNDRQTRRALIGSVNALLAFDVREVERARIEAIENEAIRSQAKTIFQIIVELDEAEADALKEWYEEVKKFTDVEAEGEELYRNWRREVAQQQIAAGVPPSYEDLF